LGFGVYGFGCTVSGFGFSWGLVTVHSSCCESGSIERAEDGRDSSEAASVKSDAPAHANVNEHLKPT